MGRLVVAAFLSIDGVMQAPGGPDEDRDGKFPFGGWLVPFADEVMGQVVTALNAKPKYVASRTLSSVDWNNSHPLEGDVVEAVRRLKSEVAGVIMTQGSGDLIQTLMEADLVDEYRLWFFPWCSARASGCSATARSPPG